MFGILKNRRRDKVKRQPFPEAWQVCLREKFPLYQKLAAADRQELEDHIKVFLDEKNFEGCAGLPMTDEIRVLIAAQACLLLLHRETDYYPQLKSILVYPNTYSAEVETECEAGIITEEEEERLGESWDIGAVVLAWDSVSGGIADPEDGLNVVIHEFAHQLDQEDGEANGTPLLVRDASIRQRARRYSRWAEIFSSEYADLQHRAARGQDTLLDDYGATDPAEFFAVASEYFFERPKELREEHPALYAELSEFYRQDPAGW